MKLPSEYVFLLFCIIIIFSFHFGKVMFASTYADFGYNRIRIKPFFGKKKELPQNNVQSDIRKSNNSEICKQFLRESLPKTIDDSFMQELSNKCIPDDVKIEDLYQLLNLNFLQSNLGNVSCERHKPHFLDSFKPLVALASFPGSGNTWTREILEQMTGIYTGSIYNDIMAFFTGSQFCPTDGKIFVVKTHLDDRYARKEGCKTVEFSKAIYIVRNPYDSIIAEFNRHTSGKITFATPKDFRSKKWRKFVKNNAKYWKNLSRFWLKDFGKPVHAIVYEHLQANAVYEIFKLMKFMDIPPLLKSLYCLSTSNFETYYRKNKPEWLTKEHLYHHQSRRILNTSIESVLATIQGNSDISNVLRSYFL